MKKPEIKLKTLQLHKVYNNSFEGFKAWDSMYNISGRLGYKSAEACWKANPKYTLNLTNNKLTKVK